MNAKRTIYQKNVWKSKTFTAHGKSLKAPMVKIETANPVYLRFRSLRFYVSVNPFNRSTRKIERCLGTQKAGRHSISNHLISGKSSEGSEKMSLGKLLQSLPTPSSWHGAKSLWR